MTSTPENQQTNGIAVAGFILALSALIFVWAPVLNIIAWLLGLIFSAIGISRAKKTGGRRKGLAIAGLVISLFWIAIFIILLVMFGGLMAIAASGA